jgi:hypothetical protein
MTEGISPKGIGTRKRIGRQRHGLEGQRATALPSSRSRQSFAGTCGADNSRRIGFYQKARANEARAKANSMTLASQRQKRWSR